MDAYVGHRLYSGDSVWSTWYTDDINFQQMRYVDPADELAELKCCLNAIINIIMLPFSTTDPLQIIYTSSVKTINSIKDGSTYSDPHVDNLRRDLKLIYNYKWINGRVGPKFRYIEKEKNLALNHG